MSGAGASGAVLMVAAAGYGKTTALRRRFSGADVRWCDGGTLHAEGRLAATVADAAGVVVIDDLPELAATDAAALAAAMEAVPPGATVALAGRFPLPGVPVHSGAAELALDEDATAELLAAEYGLLDPDLADRVRQATGGWPALVRLAAQDLAGYDAGSGDLLDALTEPGGRLRSYVEAEVLGPLPPRMRDLLRDVAGLSPLSADLAAALGHADAGRLLAVLRQLGLVSAGAVIPAVSEIAAPSPSRRRSLYARAASWYADHGATAAAVRAYAGAEAYEAAAALLDRDGPAILAAGDAAVIAEVLGRARPDRGRRLLLGDALRTCGQVMAAARAYADAAREDDWDAGLAWRTGLVHYLRGDSHAALDALAKAPAADMSAVDSALVRAWTATARLQLGQVEAATVDARAAVDAATACGDESALATAYVGLALCLSMAGGTTESDELLAQALLIAGRLGDVVLRARILTTQTYRQLREARYAEALEAARRTEQCARIAGHANLRSIALCNEADALTMLGRFDEAVRQYERATSLNRRMGSRRSAAAQLGLGEVYRRRGWAEQARGAYESAIRLAEAAGNNQVLVVALAGLALVLVADDAKAAAVAADRAAELASPGGTAAALLAQGWVAAYAADTASALALADGAAAVARTEGDRAELAGALELRAAVVGDARKARTALREAEAIWANAGAAVEAARVRCLLGDLPQAGPDDRLGALLAVDTLAAAGVDPEHANRLARREAATGASVAIHAFGRFEVLVDGVPVPPAQWQSRKARELLKILVARRGRPIARPELSLLLWPDDDPDRTGHRLSVLLSIVRGVLDPYRSLAADHYLVADSASVALDITRLTVDVEAFLADVGHGRRLRDRGAAAQAYSLLSTADERYRSELFADEPYADWAQPLREEARAAYVGALRMLAHSARTLGDPAAAVSYLVRLLAVDPYDEGGHRALVETHRAAGQHGEARRAYALYREAMAAIGVHPAYQYQLPM